MFEKKIYCTYKQQKCFAFKQQKTHGQACLLLRNKNNSSLFLSTQKFIERNGPLTSRSTNCFSTKKGLLSKTTSSDFDGYALINIYAARTFMHLVSGKVTGKTVCPVSRIYELKYKTLDNKKHLCGVAGHAQNCDLLYLKVPVCITYKIKWKGLESKDSNSDLEEPSHRSR